jgi:hypothetical protein
MEIHPCDAEGSERYREIRYQFQTSLNDWWKQMGGTDPIDLPNIWVWWYMNKRPYGVTAKMYVEGFFKEISSQFQS